MKHQTTATRMCLLLLIIACLVGLLIAPASETIRVQAAPLAQATGCYGSTITQWTFTGNVTTPSTGAGSLNYGAGLSSPTYPTGELAAENPALSFSGWSPTRMSNEYIEFRISTIGRNTLNLVFKSRISSTGPANFDLDYSTDGSTFATFASGLVSDTGGNWDTQTIDLSSLTTLNDNANAVLRLYGYSAGATSGTWRIDNVTLNGNCIVPGPTFTPTVTNTPTASNTATNTGTPTSTRTPTMTGTLPTLTPTLSPTSTPAPSLKVLINEVAWMGTAAASTDEWIELYNPGTTAIDLTGWQLKSDDGNVLITWSVTDNVMLGPGAYYLLERRDAAVSDIPADKIYSGDLLNTGATLRLLDNTGMLVDTANSDGGAWPAGAESTHSSMERIGKVQDGPTAWATYAGSANDGYGKDASTPTAVEIRGTPKQANWATTVTITPSKTPTFTRTITPTPTHTRRPTLAPVVRPVINEFLARPNFDWNQDGRVDTFDEFIEIKNIGVINVDLSGWKLDDEANQGSDPFMIGDIVLKPGQRAVFYGLETNILLGDGGDTVRLLDPSGKVYDAYTYALAKVEDQSVCRLPDGNGSWYEDCTPTPNQTNARGGAVPSMPQGSGFESPVCDLPDTLPQPFLFAECRGYGANIWNSYYWDKTGWKGGDQDVPDDASKWNSYVE